MDFEGYIYKIPFKFSQTNPKHPVGSQSAGLISEGAALSSQTFLFAGEAMYGSKG